MSFKSVTPVAIAILLAFVVTGSAEKGNAQAAQEIKISMLAPRESSLFINFKKLGEKISKATNGAWKFRIYPFGVAGDEKDVVRKMEIGQMDSAVITTTGLSILEPQIAVLDAPGLIMNYKDMEAVEKVIDVEVPQLLIKKKIKVLTSWEAGQYRVFHNASKGLILWPADLKKHRQWLWPENYILKEMWREAGSTGVPLSTIDVFGALQTGMIDTIVNSAYATVQMNWHTKMDHVSERAQGVLLFFWVVNETKWNAMPENVRTLINNELVAVRAQARSDARKNDEAAYKSLVARGYKPVRLTPQIDAEWTKLFDRVVKKLTGRLWPESLYKKFAAAKPLAK
jgi:TRAP-type transport system periplasmic protein